MPVLRTVTLGCKVNQYETEYVRQALAGVGYRDADKGEAADLCIVNTCTVTLEGDYKSRKVIRALARENPQAEIVVMGCYASRAPAEVSGLPRVVEVLTDKRQLPQLLSRFGVAEVPTGISSFGRLHRAYLKVQDGCRLQCSYCIIPQVRPAPLSRPVGEVLDEVRRLVDHGHLEIVLTGIHLGHYGLDFGERRPDGRPVDLAYLVGRIIQLPGRFRLRLSSLEAAELSSELLDRMAGRPDRLCPHLHVPMQSGSEAVLARMRRRGGIDRFIEKCHEVCDRLDKPALTTDVIVGFPGETEADFEATCRAIEEIGFSKLHIFKFSPRDGTPAAAMPEMVPFPVKHRRAAELAQIGRRLREQYCRGLVGKRLQVLIESPLSRTEGTAMLPRPLPKGEETLTGTCERYVAVDIPGNPASEAPWVEVVAREARGQRLRAEFVAESLKFL